MNEYLYECQSTKATENTQRCVKHNFYDQGVYSMLHDINLYIMKIKQAQNTMLQNGIDKDFFEVEWDKSNNRAQS